MYPNDEEYDDELVKELLSHGEAIGSIFVDEVNSLVNKHKEFTLKNDQVIIALHKLVLQRVGMNHLRENVETPIHPVLWSEFYNILSKCSELMYTEGKRIREKHDSKKGNKNDTW